MEKTKSEMRKEVEAKFARIPGREYQHACVGKIGRDYIHFVSLYEGSHKGKILIEDFIRTGSLFECALKENGKQW